MKMCEGFDHGHPEWTLTGREDIKQCIRLWPHKIKGEGHFLALLKKEDGPQPTFKYEKIKKVKLTPETEEFFKIVRWISTGVMSGSIKESYFI